MTKEIATSDGRLPMRFHLYGLVEARVGDQRVDLGGKRARRMFVALASAERNPVSGSELMEWVWDDAPGDVTQGLQDTASDLRKPLRTLGFGDALSSKDGYFTLAIPSQLVDVHQFSALTAQALRADDDERYELLGNALELCRGEPLTGLQGLRIDGYRDKLINNRRTVEVLRNKVAVKIGRGVERILDLDRLFREEPNDSRVAGLYMYALYEMGSKPEALAVYQKHWDSLEANGLDVPPEPVQRLHARMLSDDDLGPDAEAILGGPPTRPSDSSTLSSQGFKPAADADKAPAESDHRVGGINFNGPIDNMRDVVQGTVTHRYGVS